MADTFNISPTNPLRFVPIGLVTSPAYNSPSFDNSFFKDQILARQTKTSYCQKFERLDQIKTQLFSDFTDVAGRVLNVETGQEVLTLTINEVATALLGQTFKVYEFSFAAGLLDDGEYTIELTANEGAIVYQSEPFDVAESHPETVLLQYKNTDNNFSVIFETGIEFSLRVEAILDEFKPASVDTIYTDQKHNATLLNSVPFREFRLNIGGGKGVPDWITEKINRVFACDQTRIDGVFYTKIEGAKLEVNRNPDYPLTGATLSVMPVDNANLQRLKVLDQAQEGTSGNFTMIQRIQKYMNAAADVSAIALFHQNYLLEKICIYRNSPDDILLKVGTTDGGAEITEFTISEFAQTMHTDYLFEGDANVYLTGISDVPGADVSIFLVYKYLLDTSASDLGEQTGQFVRNTVYWYDETAAGDFDLDFDIVTGLGRGGTKYEGCAICDGRNGTKDMQDRFLMGWNTNPGSDFNIKGGTGGEAEHTLLRSELPHIQLQYKGIPAGNNRFSSTGGGSLFNAPQSDMLTEFLGDGEAHNNLPPYLIMIPFKKIID